MSIFSLFSRREATASSPLNLSADQFLQQFTDDAVVIDVRTAAEFEQAHLDGARHLDLYAPDFQVQLARLDHGRTYYLYCRSGNRSGQAARIMRHLGYDAYNIGGLHDLARAGAPLAA